MVGHAPPYWVFYTFGVKAAMPTFLQTYVGNFTGGTMSGTTGTFTTSLTAPTVFTSQLTVGPAPASGSGVISFAQSAGATKNPVWIYDNSSSTVLLGLTPAGVLSAGSLASLRGDIAVQAASQAAATDGSVHSGGALRVYNPGNAGQVFSFDCAKGATTVGLDYGNIALANTGYSLVWSFGSDKKIISPSGGFLLDSAIDNNNITAAYTFTGAAGILNLKNAPPVGDISTAIPNTWWVQSNYANKLITGSATVFSDTADASQFIEVAFDTAYATIQFHSAASRAAGVAYDTRISSQGGGGDGVAGGGTLDFGAANVWMHGTVNLDATNGTLAIRGSDTSYIHIGGDGYTANTADAAINRSAMLVQSVSQRTDTYRSYQYIRETVGSQYAHILGVSDGTDTYEYVFDNKGSFTCLATYADYGDLAELYTAKEAYCPGTFVHITHDDTVDYEISAAHGNHCIFGVISTNPGLLINSSLKRANALPVALTGRVPALIVGPIRKGFRVMLSDIPGVGKEGSIRPIGFALETNLSKGIKLVEIAIGGRG